jgi:ribulose-phosphate 3-epimerase
MNKNGYLICPSLLSANFAKLGEEAEAVLRAGADMLHLDVMDNHYVPNLTVGPLVCDALRKYGITAPIDVHLMVKPVDRLIIDFAEAGATNITFHPEASDHVDRSLNLIHKHGAKAGIALNPATTLDCLDYVIAKVDLVLVMSVNPGFGGQTFIPSAMQKISDLREYINQYHLHCKKHHTPTRTIRLAVDGGIKAENIGEVAKAGADMFIAGSAIFGKTDYAAEIQKMRDAIGYGDDSHSKFDVIR